MNPATNYSFQSIEAGFRIRLLPQRLVLALEGKGDYHRKECIVRQQDFLRCAMQIILEHLPESLRSEELDDPGILEIHHQFPLLESPDWTLYSHVPAAWQPSAVKTIISQDEMNQQLQSLSDIKAMRLQERMVVQCRIDEAPSSEDGLLDMLQDYCSMNNFSYLGTAMRIMVPSSLRDSPPYQGTLNFPVRKYLGNCSMC